MFDTQNENAKHWWGKEMSETRSPLSNFYGIKEPINSISALSGIIYILLYYFQYNITLKLYVIINLLFAFIAHSTYNYLAIKLDGISLALPIFHIFLYYNWYNEFIILLGLISLFRQFIQIRVGMIFAAGIMIIPFKKYNDIICYDSFCISILICCGSAICRILDQMYTQYWYFYLHSIWHFGMSIGLVILIDSLQW